MSTSTEVSQSGQVVFDTPTAKQVNNLLNSSKTRFEGLHLLSLFLPQCPDEDFLNFCISWMQSCCKLDDLTKDRNYVAHLLCKLLKISSNYPELKKSVSFFITTRYFDFFFKYLLNSEAGWTCTETCLHLYRGACGPFQESLEKHLLSEIERNANIPSAVGHCFALLPSAGGGGNDGINYKKNWKTQFVKFLSNCHSILNNLLADLEEFQEDIAPEHENNTTNSETSTEHLTVQFQNYCSVLGFMLLNQYPAPKSVPTELIFQLICRGLAINPKSLNKRSQVTNILSLQKVLPHIQSSLFSLLKSVVVTCKNQLVPYAHLICKLMKQGLQWTESDHAYGNEKPFGRLRISIYEALCEWVAVARGGSCVEVISDVVVPNAVSDFRSKRGAVFLKEAKPQNWGKSREQATRRVDAAANSELCQAALRALQFLLKFTGVLLKAEMHKLLQEAVVKLLIEIQKSTPGELVVPYAVPRCRVELYSLLLELIHQPCPKWPPPTSFALRLFAGGVNDASPQVSSFCSAALNYTTIIIHPEYDNGGFPSCDTPDSRIQMRDKIQWREDPVDAVSETGAEISGSVNESLSKSGEIDPPKRVGVNEGSEFSSDEDSRNTVTFSNSITESAAQTPKADEPRKEEILLREQHESGKEEILLREQQESVKEEILEREQPSEEKEHNVQEAEFAEEKTCTPAGENLVETTASNSPNLGEAPEKVETKKLPEGDGEKNSPDPKITSPVLPEDSHPPKGRYFLRSKTQEPEETLGRTSSVESLRGTPSRAIPRTPSSSAVPSGKRRRTRALSKMEGNGEPEAKTPRKNDEEEDITAAFFDSFVD